MENWLLKLLICPKHGGSLSIGGRDLTCATGCTFPVIQGTPVLLRDDVESTLWVATASIEKARQLRQQPADCTDPCIDTLGITPEGRASLEAALASDSRGVDPVVSHLICATNGNLYSGLVGKLPSYPIPNIKLAPADGDLLLDIGCNWGRWCIAAARKGYRVVGIDPSLGGVLAAQRLCRELGVDAQFVVGDARHLPFTEAGFDGVYSYSVLQHLAKADVRESLHEIRRVLKPGRRSLIQMPNVLGIRSFYNLARRGFQEGRGFDVRYWTRRELRTSFERAVGPSTLEVDCFFGLGIQETDKEMLPPFQRLVVSAAEMARKTSSKIKVLESFADSVFVSSVKAF